jgi:TM2 domain-containing membrane protein YozV
MVWSLNYGVKSNIVENNSLIYMSESVMRLFFMLGVAILAILLLALGFDSFQYSLLLALVAGIGAVAFYHYLDTHPDKEIQTGETGKNEGEAVPEASSFWNRETPLVSEEQMQDGIYAVSDKGYVQAAVLFSFIMPGLGQSYNGQYLKGAVLTISGLTLVWAIGMWALIVWLIGAVDAYLSAKKVISNNLRPTSGFAFFLHISMGALFMFGLLVFLTTFFKRV